MNNIKFIVYHGQGMYEEEVLITTPELEEEFLKIWFHHTGRDLDDYARTTHSDTGIRVRVSGLRVM